MLVKLAVLIGIIYCLYCLYCSYGNIKEKWVDYVLKPYGYVDSGSDPVHYYRRDRYRKPYREGYKFVQSYPYKHNEPLP